MRAPAEDLRTYFALTQSAAIVRRLCALGAPAHIDANRQPAVPLAWWEPFIRGEKPLSSPSERTQSIAANDSANELNLSALPQGRAKRGT